jgi:hypothetical protein
VQRRTDPIQYVQQKTTIPQLNKKVKMTEELDFLASNSVPLIDSRNTVQDYFRIGASHLRSAKQYNEGKDYKNTYIELKCYTM